MQAFPVAQKWGITEYHRLKGFICKVLHKTERSIHIPLSDANIVSCLICSVLISEKPAIFRKNRTYPSFLKHFRSKSKLAAGIFILKNPTFSPKEFLLAFKVMAL